MTQKLFNGYLKIKPLKHDSFIQMEKSLFEEVGEVLAKDESITQVEIGSLVFFDAWMIAKYPDPQNPKEFIYLVPFSEIKMGQTNG